VAFALHEAGHAVCAAVLKRGVDEVYVSLSGGGCWHVPVAERKTDGHQKALEGLAPSQRAQDAFLDPLVVSLGGAVVQKKIGDDDQARAINCSADLRDVFAIIKTVTKTEEEAEELLYKAVRLASEIVNEFWPAVCDLAIALHGQRRLYADQIKKILAPHGLSIARDHAAASKPKLTSNDQLSRSLSTETAAAAAARCPRAHGPRATPRKPSCSTPS
jgi:hypothetical protein